MEKTEGRDDTNFWRLIAVEEGKEKLFLSQEREIERGRQLD